MAHLSESTPTFNIRADAIVAGREHVANQKVAAIESAFFQMEVHVVSQPQRIEIKFFGTHIRAEGMAGIIGAITIVGVILIIYFGGYKPTFPHASGRSLQTLHQNFGETELKEVRR